MWQPQGPDLVTAVEAAYAIDRPDPEWLRGLLDAVRPALDAGLGIAGYLYDLHDRPFRIRDLTVVDCPVDAAGVAALQDPSYDAFVRRSWIGRAAMTASETPGYDRHPGVHEVFHPAGIRDLMVVNALDASGIGCWIGVPLPALRTLRDDERRSWNRVAAHIRSSLRLRQRLKGPPAAAEVDRTGATEAVLDRAGKLVDATAPAAEHSQALQAAVAGIERARAWRKDGGRALPSWPALVRARWTLVEEVTVDGARYILARANAMTTSPLTVLSSRERQVVACLALGLTNKETAYELGLSASTVRVLLARACAKLGVDDREALLAAYRREV